MRPDHQPPVTAAIHSGFPYGCLPAARFRVGRRCAILEARPVDCTSLLAAFGVGVLPATVLAERSLSFVTPTTMAVIVTPSTTTALDLVQATVAPDVDGSDVPLGAIDTSGVVPDGLDITAFPGAPETPAPAADGPTLAAGLVDTGSDVSSVYVGVARHVDLVLFTFRQWEASQFTFCESLDPDVLGAQGDSDGLCGSWNSAVLGSVDLDVIPAGRGRWTSTTMSATFSTSSGGGVLPDGNGDPRLFHFSAR